MDKKEIKSIYATLKGYHKTLSSLKVDYFDNEIVWNNYNSEIDELNKISGRDYSKFKIVPEGNDLGDRYYYSIGVSVFKFNLSGLLARLHDEYFPEDLDPFSISPVSVTNISQNQSQITIMQIVLEFQGKIDEKLPEYKEGTKERSFLERVKSALSGVSNVTQLVSLIFSVGKDLGMTAEQIYNIFK